VTVVVDHMGLPDIAKGVDHPDFQRFVELMADNRTSVEGELSSGCRSGPPDYADVAPFAKALVDRFTDRVLWGTDWPHPNMKSHMPDDGKLTDVIPNIATSAKRRSCWSRTRATYWE
jgi:2-pyrone-4,6-dicarboxylate lactonase